MKTLAIDIGGTGLKASVLDEQGKMLVDHVRTPTPHPGRPKDILPALVELMKQLPDFDRISAGFPGVVRHGTVITAPHLGTKAWRGFALQDQLAKLFGKPARVENDAEVQGLGIITGHGLEVVLTLGTGIGSAVFDHGRMTPHLELAHHPIHKSATYDDYIGDAARRKLGRKKWTARVLRAIEIVHALLNYDTLYLGGGNSANLTARLPANVKLASNDRGITGGIRLWDDAVWRESSR
jgi:polyphosphate glucokinase